MCVVVLAVALPAVAQVYPSKPIRLIVPFPPGGGTDIAARLIGLKLTERWGQQVIVDNRGGANAMIGTQLAARAAPDGYTLLLGLPASIAVNPSLYRNVQYDPVRDFAPVIQLNSIPLLLAAHPSVAAQSVADLVQLARAKPGQLTFASSGTGGSSHFAMELFKIAAKVDMVHVPYKGGGPAVNDLLAGQVHLYSGTVIGVVPFVRAGRLKALGITAARRAPDLPDIPAIAETIPGYESVTWQGLLVPSGTPASIVQKINRDVAAVLQLQDVRERLGSDGTEMIGGSPADFGAVIKRDIARYAKLIREAGIRAD